MKQIIVEPLNQNSKEMKKETEEASLGEESIHKS